MPPSWGGDHKLQQPPPHQRHQQQQHEHQHQQHGAVPKPPSRAVHEAATRSLTAEEDVLAAATARALRRDMDQSKYQRCDDGAGAASAVIHGCQPSPLLAATLAATAADQGGAGGTTVQSCPAKTAGIENPAKRAKKGRVKISRAQTLAAGSVIQPYWDSGILAQRNESVWERICAEVNAEWDAQGLESPLGASPRYTLQNLNSWFRNATYKKVCVERDYNPPSWGGSRISTKIRRKYTRRDQHNRAGTTSLSRQGHTRQGHTYPWTVSENQALLQAVQTAGASQSDAGGSFRPDWDAVARRLRLINIAEGGPMQRVRTAEAIARQHSCLVNEIDLAVGQVVSALVHDVEEEALEMQTATISYWEDAVRYNKRQQQRLLSTTGDGNGKVSAADNRVFPGGATSAVAHNSMPKGSQWTQCTGLYVLEHVDEAKQLYARIAHRAKRQRIVDYISNSILQDGLNRAAAIASGHGKSGSTQFILNVFSEERKARLAAAMNKRLVEADLPPDFSVSRVEAWLNTAIRSQYGSTDRQLEMGRNSSSAGHQPPQPQQPQQPQQLQHQLHQHQHQHQHQQREEYEYGDEYGDENDGYGEEYDENDEQEEQQQLLRHPPKLTSNAALFDLAAAMITGETDDTSGGGLAAAESLPHIGDAEQLLVELSSPRDSECQAESSEGSLRNHKHDESRHGNEAVESSYDAEGGVHKLASSQPQAKQPLPPSVTSSSKKSEDEVTPVNRSPICQFTARLLLPSPGQPQQAGGEPVATKRRRVMPASLAQQLAQQHRASTADMSEEQQLQRGPYATAAPAPAHYTMRPSTARYYAPEEVPEAGLFSRASVFVNKVKAAFLSSPFAFEEFLRILTDFQLERISRATVLIRVAELFNSNGGHVAGEGLFAEFVRFSPAEAELDGASGGAGASHKESGACTMEAVAEAAAESLLGARVLSESGAGEQAAYVGTRIEQESGGAPQRHALPLGLRLIE